VTVLERKTICRQMKKLAEPHTMPVPMSF
jgi:hypothetical protein